MPNIELTWQEPLVTHNTLPISVECTPSDGITRRIETNAPVPHWVALVQALNDTVSAPIVVPPCTVSFGLTADPMRPEGRRCFLAPIMPADLGQVPQRIATGIPFRRHPGGHAAPYLHPWFEQEAQAFCHANRILVNRPLYDAGRHIMPHGTKPPVMFFPTLNQEATYAAFEFECEFSSSSTRDDTISRLWRHNDTSLVQFVPTLTQGGNRAVPRRFYIETDSSLRSPAIECVTTPHAIHDPGTYYQFSRIFGELCRNGLNQGGRCGMHMHLSRTYISRMSRPKQDALDNFIMCALLYAKSQQYVFQYLTGRDTESDYALVAATRGHRFRGLNWTNAVTLEFRFPGPGLFTDPNWPCFTMDFILAMVDAGAYAIMAPMGNLSPLSTSYVRQLAGSNPANRDLHCWAMRSTFRFIKLFSDAYPFAYAYLTKPSTPDVLKRLFEEA